jgi:hypothetical protein
MDTQSRNRHASLTGTGLAMWVYPRLNLATKSYVERLMRNPAAMAIFNSWSLSTADEARQRVKAHSSTCPDMC